MSRQNGFSAKIVLLSTMVYAVVTLMGLAGQIADAQQIHAELEAKCESLQGEIAQLNSVIASSESEERVRQNARDMLGMGNTGEIILYSTK